MGEPAANRPNPPPIFQLPSSIFHLLSSISHPSCILFTECSESFSCIWYTESSESWTTASLARIVVGVKTMIQTRCRLSLNRRAPPAWAVQETPTSLISLPALRATTSHKSVVLLISKLLRGYLRGSTPHSS